MANTFAFIQAVKGQAIKDMKAYGILSSLTIAQAILESAWGESGLTEKANNLFGIKKGSGWKGEFISLPTMEHINGRAVKTEALFRKYDSWAESINDHTKLLLNDRYKPLIGVIDYKDACRIIKECGYATDIGYTNKLIRIIETYRLHEFDISIIIEGLMKEMDVKELQRWLNANGFTDKNGNKLDVDGREGDLTKSAKEKAKTLLNYILK